MSPHPIVKHTPANVSELAMVPALAEQPTGFLVGDRNYWKPTMAAELRQVAIALLAPYRWASRDPALKQSAYLSRIRYRIETVFGQLVERCRVKRVWARDAWHLWNRLLRTVLTHPVAVLLTVEAGNPPLQLARLVV